jgi:hypothetical protein
MKKFLCMSMLALLTFGGCEKFDPAYIESEVNDLKNRMTAIEQWATTVNSNITALQGIVATLQNADYITGVTTFASPAPGGYVISLLKGGTITISNGAAGRDGTNGTNGTDGRDGANGQDGANGTDGQDGTNGQDGAAGHDGVDGQDGASPQISVRQDIDGVYYWTLNGEWIVANGNKLRVTGEKGANGNDGQDGQNGQDGQDGQNGQDGVTPQIRINTASNKWEISYTDGASWEPTDIKATGPKGDTGTAGANGDAIFAANGIDYSSPDHVIFTLADGMTTITVPKYKKLGLNFAQPGAFAAGETKIVAYTPEGDVAVIKFIDMPAGWQASVNYYSHTFAITAPATLDSNDKGGEIILLISDNDQNMIMRTIYFVTSDSHITIDGYSGNSITVDYSDGTHVTVTKSADNSFAVPANYKIIASIALEGGATILAGREADGSAIAFKLSGSNLVFRDAVAGTIPVGSYAEFQLINTVNSGSYKQEVDLDLLDLEWTPILFSGTFDGDNHTLANLKISENNDQVGLFGYTSGATIRNVHVISGSVSGKEYVGGICGQHENGGVISGCSNACLVSGSGNNVGGVCGYSYSSSITSCYNTGSVSGSASVGGVCGYSSYSITSCYNTGSVSGSLQVGGVCGVYMSYSSITSCYNTGSVSGSGYYVGGVCGRSSGTTTSCYNTGSVSGSFQVGGVCGSSSSSITSCYNTGSVSGSSYNDVGGVCGSSSSSITSCYNTGSVSGSGDNVGGVCGRSSGTTTSCYNTGSVSGSSNVGGVCGNTSSSITSCYNTGSVSGSSNVGGVCGSPSSTPLSIIACYWKDIPSDDADYGLGNASNTGTTIFAPGAWPTTETHQQWGIGNGSSAGKYWKSLGSWNGGNPVYPTLWFEE